MVTKKRELRRDEILRSFGALPDDATVEDFIDHLADVIDGEQRRSEEQAKRAIPGSGLLDCMNKQQLMKSLDKLPKDATIDDFVYRLYVISKVEKAVAEGRAGNKVTQEEARERMKRWLR